MHSFKSYESSDGVFRYRPKSRRSPRRSTRKTARWSFR